MGSFAYTCAVSSLPIEAGDKVRILLLTESPYKESKANAACYMTDWWFPRTFPLRAEYNDYGSVENVEEGVARDVWLEAFKIDLIEVGTGDNSVHDVPTSKDMSFDQLLCALQEGRILVSGDISPRREHPDIFKKEDPEYVPTMKRVWKKLVDSKIYKDAEKKFLVDELQYGEIRVRAAGYSERKEPVIKAEGVLSKHYSTMLRAGSGNYAHNIELIVCTPPNEDHTRIARIRTDRHLPVSYAMIREDVWQAMLSIPVRDWRSGKKNVDFFRAEARKEYDNIQKSIANMKSISDPAIKDIIGKLDLRYRSEMTEAYEFMLGREVVPFTIALNAHWSLAAKHEKSADEISDFLDSVAEMRHVIGVLSNVRYIWIPSSSRGAQFGEFPRHSEFLSKMSGVARSQRKKR